MEGSVGVAGVTCRFGTRVALDRVDLEVGPGEIHALLGPNGAGKTTLIRALSGLVEPQEGAVTIDGAVGLVPSGDRSFYLRISALENLIFFARLHGLGRHRAKARAREVLADVGLDEAANRPVGRCSHGMQKRLSVARALLVRPRVLLVDEATHDLDPEGAHRIRGLVRACAAEGTAVLWTTQRLDEIQNFADCTTLLVTGRTVFSGSPTELAAQAPADRYQVEVRAPDRARQPALAAVQLAIGGSATAVGVPQNGYQFVLAPRERGDLGLALARLVGAGFEVVGCHQPQSELEEAFLLLTSEAAA